MVPDSSRQFLPIWVPYDSLRSNLHSQPRMDPWSSADCTEGVFSGACKIESHVSCMTRILSCRTSYLGSRVKRSGNDTVSVIFVAHCRTLEEFSKFLVHLLPSRSHVSLTCALPYRCPRSWTRQQLTLLRRENSKFSLLVTSSRRGRSDWFSSFPVGQGHLEYIVSLISLPLEIDTSCPWRFA